MRFLGFRNWACAKAVRFYLFSQFLAFPPLF